MLGVVWIGWLLDLGKVDRAVVKGVFLIELFKAWGKDGVRIAQRMQGRVGVRQEHAFLSLL